MHLLSDYIIDAHTRYEAHTLIYTPADDMPVELGGMLGAAVLAALLVDTPEGDARGIAVDSTEQREQFFLRYEREVRRENGGLLTTEVQSLSRNYMEMTGTDGMLFTICGNDRLFDLAIGLMIDYMQRLVREQVCPSIYELVAWREPFAQWLYDAAFIETRRQYLLSINWTDEAAVHALNETLQAADNERKKEEPTFFFEGVSSEHILTSYFQWLWDAVRQQTSVMPDAQEQLAQLCPQILAYETNWDFIRPEIAKLSPEHINLFRKWMTQWTEFVTRKLGEHSSQSTFPAQSKPIKFQQVLFPDNILSCPEENNYVQVRDYILERCRYDQSFASYYTTHTRVQLCEQLSALFGWVVDANSLGKRLNYNKKYKK